MDKITSEIMQYIKEIADKMKNSRASIMVGAGFSRNAEKNTPTDKEFLDWNSLGDIFYEKLHGHMPGDKDRYLNALKLAEEVESTFGRTVLNQLIKDSLPDDEYSPSVLHEKLLRLNWRDIFTTNYDTLLERTQENISDKHYNVVLNKEDLIYSKEPRIIKLHGSFPSVTPFIITEEDYRRYPKEYAVFVNTVQQALIENVLCLVGFSGDDPNFLQWIGWIRDNIGKDLASKIYLVGVFNFSTSQLKVLEKRNIIVLNMRDCLDVKDYENISSEHHKKGLHLFFDALNTLTVEQNPDSWPKENHFNISPFDETDIVRKVKSITEEWKKTRLSYPGWYMLSSSRRKKLQLNTKWCDLMRIIRYLKELEAIDSFKYLYEYSWRQNMSLIPISRHEIKFYEQIIYGLNPFATIVPLREGAVSYEKDDQEWHDISKMWTELLLCLLSAYREHGMFSKFDDVIKILEQVKSELNKEQIAQLQCEKVKKAIFNLNIKEAKENLIEWKYDVSLPNWEIKRVGILMELGDISQAKKIVADELNYIRRNYNKTIDYYKLTLEAYFIVLSTYIKQANRLFERDTDIDDNSIDKKEALQNESTLKLFDPYEETRLFEAYLSGRLEDIEYDREEFDLNRYTKTIVATADDSETVAFQFLRYYENIGMPFSCNHVVSSKKALKESIRRINPYTPFWSLVLQVKSNDSKLADVVWTRENISKMSNHDVETMSKICIAAIKDKYQYIESGNRLVESNLQLGIAKMMPEILSRLCTRMTDDMKIETLDALNLIYKSSNIGNFKNVEHLADRLVKSMSEELKIKALPLMINTHLYVPRNDIERRTVADIFEEFSTQINSIEKYKDIKIDQEIVDNLLDLMNDTSSRENAIERLEKLYTLNLLNDAQTQTFCDRLWSVTDNFGLPVMSDKYTKNYLNYLPTPQDVNLEELLKKYILSLDIMKEQPGVIFYGAYAEPKFIIELASCTYDMSNEHGIKWNRSEVEIIISQILSAWNNDKQYLTNEDDDSDSKPLYHMVMSKYKSLDKVLYKVLLSDGTYDYKTEELKNLAQELDSFGLPCALLSILCTDEQDNNQKLDLIYDSICSSEISIVINACDLVYALCLSNVVDIDIETLLEKISLNIKTRRFIGLHPILIMMYNIIYSGVFPDSNIILDNILFGLECLESETRLESNIFNCTTNQCIILREAAMSLASIIYSHYADDSVRNRLRVWKDKSKDLSEFSEVRNRWIV